MPMPFTPAHELIAPPLGFLPGRCIRNGTHQRLGRSLLPLRHLIKNTAEAKTSKRVQLHHKYAPSRRD
jgi:hypothetical protein